MPQLLAISPRQQKQNHHPTIHSPWGDVGAYPSFQGARCGVHPEQVPRMSQGLFTHKPLVFLGPSEVAVLLLLQCDWSLICSFRINAKCCHEVLFNNFLHFFFPRMKIFVQVGMPHTAALCQTWPSPLCPYFLPCPQLTVSSGTLWRLHPKWVSSVFSFQLLTGSRCRFDDWRERDISSSDAFCSSGSHQKRKSLLCPASHEHRIESVCVCVYLASCILISCPAKEVVHWARGCYAAGVFVVSLLCVQQIGGEEGTVFYLEVCCEMPPTKIIFLTFTSSHLLISRLSLLSDVQSRCIYQQNTIWGWWNNL